MLRCYDYLSLIRYMAPYSLHVAMIEQLGYGKNPLYHPTTLKMEEDGLRGAYWEERKVLSEQSNFPLRTLLSDYVWSVCSLLSPAVREGADE